MRHIFQVFSFDILAKVFLGAMGILLIRFLAPSEYARYTLAVSMVTMVTMAFATSFNRLYIVGRQRLQSIDSSGFLGLQLTAILGLAVLASAFYGKIGPIYWLIILAATASTLTEFSKTFFQEQMRFLRFSFIELTRTVMMLAGVGIGLAVLGRGMAAWQVVGIQALSMLLVFSTVFARRIEPSRVFRLRDAWRLVQDAARNDFAYLFGYFFLFAFFGQIDIWMLRFLANDEAVATYGSAFRYYAIVIMGLSSVHVVLLPFTQRAGNIQQLRTTFKKYSRLVAMSAPLILVGAWLSQWIIPLIDGGKYPQAIPVFRILAISSIISLAFSPYVNTVMRFGKFRYLLALVCAGIGISVTGNLVLVPNFGAIGTAFTTLISFAFVNGMTFLKGSELMMQSECLPDESCAAEEKSDARAASTAESKRVAVKR